MSTREFKISFATLLQFYQNDADSPYLCDVIVEYIRDVGMFPSVINYRDKISWQFYQQWMTICAPECEKLSSEDFQNSFQTMEDWNRYSDLFVGLDRSNSSSRQMREYRVACFERAIELAPDYQFTFEIPNPLE
jgi:hypothetical protein